MTGRARRPDEGRPLDFVSVGAATGAPRRPEILEQGPAASGWERRWQAVPRRRRRQVAGAAAVSVAALVLGPGLVQGQAWLAERVEARRVVVETTMGVSASSNAASGGYVNYYVTVRNGGTQPLELTSLETSGDRVDLRSRGAGSRRVAPGREVLVPVSALLTCPGRDGPTGDQLLVDLDVTRADGESARQTTSLNGVSLVLDVAETLCRLRPDLRDYELSGPVLQAAAGEG